jgi:hypothetical protein
MSHEHNQKKLHFPKGSRVRVSESGGWKQAFTGTVRADPEPTVTLLGANYIHWVEFDEPQECIDGSDLYVKGQILGSYLEDAS